MRELSLKRDRLRERQSDLKKKKILSKKEKSGENKPIFLPINKTTSFCLIGKTKKKRVSLRANPGLTRLAREPIDPGQKTLNLNGPNKMLT